MGKEIGKRWQRIDAILKLQYQERADREKKRYEQQLVIYNSRKRQKVEEKRTDDNH